MMHLSVSRPRAIFVRCRRRVGPGVFLRSPGLVSPSAYFRGASMFCRTRELRLPGTLPDPPAPDPFEATPIDGEDSSAKSGGSTNKDDAAGGRVGDGPGSRSSRVRQTGKHVRSRRWENRGSATVGAIPDPPAGCHRFRCRLLRRAKIKLRHDPESPDRRPAGDRSRLLPPSVWGATTPCICPGSTRLFGTAYEPARRPARYGLAGEVAPVGVLAQLAWPFRRMPR